MVIAARLKAAGQPVRALITYTAVSDPNHLLGRQGEYTSKVAWQDPRALAAGAVSPSDDPGGIENGGGIEVLPSVADAAQRLAELKSFKPPLGDGYDYRVRDGDPAAVGLPHPGPGQGLRGSIHNDCRLRRAQSVERRVLSAPLATAGGALFAWRISANNDGYERLMRPMLVMQEGAFAGDLLLLIIDSGDDPPVSVRLSRHHTLATEKDKTQWSRVLPLIPLTIMRTLQTGVGECWDDFAQSDAKRHGHEPESCYAARGQDVPVPLARQADREIATTVCRRRAPEGLSHARTSGEQYFRPRSAPVRMPSSRSGDRPRLP